MYRSIELVQTRSQFLNSLMALTKDSPRQSVKKVSCSGYEIGISDVIVWTVEQKRDNCIVYRVKITSICPGILN